MSRRCAPWGMLFVRLLLFLAIQALLALGFWLARTPEPWARSANWWPLIVAAANASCLVLLVRLMRAEGQRYAALFRIDRRHALQDVLIVLGSFIVGGPLAYFPNVLLGGWLFGDPNATLDLFVRPLPWWAAYSTIVLFPITQGLAELATYFGYVMPRLERQGLPTAAAVALPALLLGLQHIAVPLLFDTRFILWRGLMYIPFALYAGLLLRWRPRLLPYMALIHAVMNASFATMFLAVAY